MSYLSKTVSRHLILGLTVASVLMWAIPAGADTVFHYRFEDTPGFLVDSGPNGLDLTAGVTERVTMGTPVQYLLPATGAGSKFDDPIPQTGQTNAKALQLDGTAYICARTTTRR